MATATGATLLARVRALADEPDDGDGAKAYVTDTMIYSWLSEGYRQILRALIRSGYPIGGGRDDFSPPQSSLSISDALAISAVYVDVGATRRQLPRLNIPDEPRFTGSSARGWKPTVSVDGTFGINLYPSETLGTVRVFYVEEPADIASGSSIFLPDSALAALTAYACRMCKYRRGDAQGVVQFNALYAEKMADLEGENFAGDLVVRNTDSVYRPGYDQGDPVNDPYHDYYDWGVYVVS